MIKRIIPVFLLMVLPVSVSLAQPIKISSTSELNTNVAFSVIMPAYDKIGYNIELKTFPAERSLMLSNSGKYDAELYRVKGIEKDYPNLIRIPVQINFIDVAVFSKRFDFQVSGWESLKPFSIIFRKGIKHYEYKTRGMDVTTFYTTEKLFELVGFDRYDVCIEGRMMGLMAVKKLGLSRVKMLTPPLERIELFHYVNKKNEKLVPLLTKTLEEMKNRGEIDRIRNDYIRELGLEK